MSDVEYEMNDDVTDVQDDELQIRDEFFFGMYRISDFCDFPVCPF